MHGIDHWNVHGNVAGRPNIILNTGWKLLRLMCYIGFLLVLLRGVAHATPKIVFVWDVATSFSKWF